MSPFLTGRLESCEYDLSKRAAAAAAKLFPRHSLQKPWYVKIAKFTDTPETMTPILGLHRAYTLSRFAIRSEAILSPGGKIKAVLPSPPNSIKRWSCISRSSFLK